MAGKIFIWVGHPRHTSLSHALADAYQRGAEAHGAEVRRMNLHDMEFDADLTDGYTRRKMLEPDLFDWQQNTTWADHLCWVYPLWWGGMPAKMKGVIDRAFLPGFAMQYHEKGPFWDRLLKGRTADVLMTADAPVMWDRFVYGRPGMKQVTRTVLKFAGIRVTDTRQFSPVKGASPKTIENWLRRAYHYGGEAGRR